jgi:CubicO group peptidase (beta-lactamase class C family)
VTDQAWGVAQRPDRPMRTDTIFDLGSITKVAATTAVVMALVERGALDLDVLVSSWIDGVDGRVTLTHLLTHRAGLWEWWPVYFRAGDRAAAIEFVSALELRYPVDAGRHYSDLGFMLLGEIVRRATGDELEAVAKRLVFDPLGMRDTGFRPAPELRPRIAATSHGDRIERAMVATGKPYPVAADPAEFRGWREHTLVGEVNDGNAHHAFGGVAGHAGLFSTAGDLAAFGQALAEGGAGVWDEAIVRRFTRDGADSGQGLGFWTRRHAGRGFGHGGFPGTELLVVPEEPLVVVLLTNRLHAPGRPSAIDASWREVLRLVGA